MIALLSINLWNTLFLACFSTMTRRSALLYLVKHKRCNNTLNSSHDKNHYNTADINKSHACKQT